MINKPPHHFLHLHRSSTIQPSTFPISSITTITLQQITTIPQQPPKMSIHFTSKTSHTTTHLVPLLTPLPPLPPSSVHIRPRLLALTTNTFTYAIRGALRIPGLAWWDAWPTPPAASLPAPFADTVTQYARVSAWGYSEVVESTVSGLEVGTWLFGYQPIGTAVEVLALEEEGEGGWREVSERRRGLVGEREGLGWDAVMGVLFQTGYMLNRAVFAWDGPGVHPSGGGAWGAAEADLAGAVVVLLAPSGKTGLAFAHQLRRGRPTAQQPARVVAVGSAQSRPFSVQTGLFDEVLAYGDVESGHGVLERVWGSGGGQQGDAKVVLVNFGARGDAADRWADALRHSARRFQVVLVGGAPDATTRGELAGRAADPTSGVVQMNAGGLRATLGADFFVGQDAAWKEFKDGGGVPGLSLSWGRGIEALQEGWDALAKGEYGPEVGLVYELE
ncbi:hypothetical protein B0H67DRAFT_673487 [Lasiosphaeris hirsuta]|uniref:Uncharacterized protein n=1 Tax=Lasiosphaeris hirsuta TaxID=260670 RepID=A0AA40DII0_9PEZI|nr:hypothetical protein B0H67DRAFT_673487 [Lasiosphaeris hirsuta]